MLPELLPGVADLEYTSALHRAHDHAIVFAGEAAQAAVRESVHLVGQVVHGAAAFALHLTFVPGYHTAVKHIITAVRTAAVGAWPAAGCHQSGV